MTGEFGAGGPAPGRQTLFLFTENVIYLLNFAVYLVVNRVLTMQVRKALPVFFLFFFFRIK